MFGDNLERIVEGIAKNYEADEIFFTKPSRRFPSRTALTEMLKDIRRVVFPGYFGTESLTGATSPDYFIGDTLIRIEQTLRTQLVAAFDFRDGDTMDLEDITQRSAEVCTFFFDQLPDVQRTLLTDVQAALDGDPAAQSKEEIIFSYPGLYAIFVYRVAHILYSQDVPLIPRILTEYAHSGTGVDINAGAVIGEYFFIDHATGVVIGETTTIGDHVKLYQGVTLGALSTRGGQMLRGVKRHPTIEDDVTIYANASVLGGETIIGKGSIIGGSAFLTESIPPHTRVSLKSQELSIRTKDQQPVWCWEI